MKSCTLFASVFTVILLAGCAHPIVISPDIAKIERAPGTKVIEKNVGYYVTGDREKDVITAGGGGDKVKYKPYKDIETGFYKMLSNVFAKVSALKSESDPSIALNEVNYVISLDVSTNSSSSSMFTWPPTDFGVNLTCNIKDATGKEITSLQAIGVGKAEFNEFVSDYSLSAKRASQDALLKMQAAMLNSPELRAGLSDTARDTIPQSSAQSSISHEEKLKELKQMHEAGLISDDIYLERQKAILSDL